MHQCIPVKATILIKLMEKCHRRVIKKTNELNLEKILITISSIPELLGI
jgi:hypothetical protein